MLASGSLVGHKRTNHRRPKSTIGRSCPIADKLLRCRIGALMNLAADDPLAQIDVAGFVGGLQERGWSLGGNLQIEYRWGTGDENLYRKYAAELVALAPDVILAI